MFIPKRAVRRFRPMQDMSGILLLHVLYDVLQYLHQSHTPYYGVHREYAEQEESCKGPIIIIIIIIILQGPYNNNNNNNYTFPVRRLGVFRDDLMIARCKGPIAWEDRHMTTHSAPFSCESLSIVLAGFPLIGQLKQVFAMFRGVTTSHVSLLCLLIYTWVAMQRT
jgi:hypothetical protein